MQTALGEARGRRDNCELVVSRAASIIGTVTQIENKMARERMWSRDDPIWELLPRIPSEVSQWPQRVRQAVQFETKDREPDTNPLVQLLLISIIAATT